MAGAKGRTPYPSDLTDSEWRRIHPLVIHEAPVGRKRTVELRDVVDAVMYRLRSRCPWRMLPHDYPPWETVYYYYRRWRVDGTLDTICSELRVTLTKNSESERRNTKMGIYKQ